MKRSLAVAAAAVIAGAVSAGVAIASASPGSSGPSPSSPPSATAPPGAGHIGAFGERFGVNRTLLHGEAVTLDRQTGKIVLQDSQNGKVTERSGATITVRSSDGTAWVWMLTSDTVVRTDDFGRGSASDIKVGDTVMISGTRAGDVRTAGWVGDPPPDLSAVRTNLRQLRGDLRRLRESLPR